MTSLIHKIPINPDLYYPVKIMYGNNCIAIREIQGKYLLDKTNPDSWRYYDDETNEWLDSTCDDPECEYCTKRPDTPTIHILDNM